LIYLSLRLHLDFVDTYDTSLVSLSRMTSQDDIRQRILLKARDKFAALGYHKASMSELAAELGMSKKTIHKFFPTKLKLAEELLNHSLAQIDRQCDAILDSPLPATEKLHRILHVIAEQQSRFVTKALLESLNNHLPHLWQRVETFRQKRMRKNMQAILDQGERDGTVRRDVNRDMFFHFLFGALAQGITPEVLIHASYSFKEALNGLMNIFVNGILTEAGREQYRKLMAANLSLE